MRRVEEIARREIGAQVLHHAVSYRVWAPDSQRVSVQVEEKGGSRQIELDSEDDGFWSQLDDTGQAGDLYRLELDGRAPIPDPASRFQPQGVFGPSECIDPASYVWRNAWNRPRWNGQTTYEIHFGTFTSEGTFRSAVSRLAHLKELGVDAVEIMPIADFAGDRNWGYDGVALFAPARCYGRPDDLRAFVDAAHGYELAVVIDLVFNHLGPQGNFLPQFSSDYFRKNRHTPWGSAFNLDGPRNGPVRDYLLTNVRHWLDEYRFDGIRLDATHAIPDDSPNHILEEISRVAHERQAFVVVEDERNCARLFNFGQGTGVDVAWADDFHHQVRVALTGASHSYYSGYQGTAGALADTLKHGWFYRGAPYPPWQGRTRGDPCDQLPTNAFVFCIENHDQIGNRPGGERLEQLVTPGKFRAASALLCLTPYPVLIFMGQDWAARSPFLYFTNHGGELGRQITLGRRKEFGEGPGNDSAEPLDPEAASSFEASKLHWEELHLGRHAEIQSLYKACLKIRRSLHRAGALERERWNVTADKETVRIEYRFRERKLLLFTNLTSSSPWTTHPKPDSDWVEILSTESTEFGGSVADGAAPGANLRGPATILYGEHGAKEDLWH